MPSVGAMTMVGLVSDWAVWVQDDLSLAVSDFYMEQLQQGNIRLDGPGAQRGAHTGGCRGDGSGGAVAQQPRGRVTVSFAKMSSVGGKVVSATGYSGDVTAMMGFCFGTTDSPSLTQAGGGALNVTVLGNAFWGQSTNSSVLGWHLASDDDGYAVGNLVAFYGSSAAQTIVYPDRGDAAAAAALVAGALDDLRSIGFADLALNHPGVLATA